MENLKKFFLDGLAVSLPISILPATLMAIHPSNEGSVLIARLYLVAILLVGVIYIAQEINEEGLVGWLAFCVPSVEKIPTEDQ